MEESKDSSVLGYNKLSEEPSVAGFNKAAKDYPNSVAGSKHLSASKMPLLWDSVILLHPRRLHLSQERSMYLQEVQGSLLLLLQLFLHWKEVLSLQPLHEMSYQEGSRKKATTVFKAKLPESGRSKSRSNKMEIPTTIATKIKADYTLNDVEEIMETQRISYSLSVHDPGDGDSRVSTRLIKEFAEISKEECSQEGLCSTLPCSDSSSQVDIIMKKSQAASTTMSSLKAASTVVESHKVPAAVATTLKASITVTVSVETLTTVQSSLNTGPNNHVTPEEAKKETKAVKKENSKDNG